jgi:hypothetical protein
MSRAGGKPADAALGGLTGIFHSAATPREAFNSAHFKLRTHAAGLGSARGY